MNAGPDPWALPGLGRWLGDLAQRLGHGLAVLVADQSRPQGVVESLRTLMRVSPVDVHGRDASPAEALAEAFGTAPTLDALLNPALEHELATIYLDEAGPDEVAEWSVFLGRFAGARSAGRAGPALLIVDPPPELHVLTVARQKSWRAGLRRGDLVIWAEEHLPATREGLTADVAVALAVDLCAWRLDLGAALVQARLDDLAAPIDWLARRAEGPIVNADPPCPLALLGNGGTKSLNQRIWKAQLAALFPAIEDQRLEIVAAHRNRLRIDDHSRSRGVTSVEELELGALRYQLRSQLIRPEADRLEILWRARNALAHREPVDPDDILHLLQSR